MEDSNPIKTTCPHCGGAQCFEENQTIPGASEGDTDQLVTSWMCMDCGYTSTTLNEEGSEVIQGYEDSTAELIKDLRWVDPSTNDDNSGIVAVHLSTPSGVVMLD